MAVAGIRQPWHTPGSPLASHTLVPGWPPVQKQLVAMPGTQEATVATFSSPHPRPKAKDKHIKTEVILLMEAPRDHGAGLMIAQPPLTVFFSSGAMVKE